MTVDRGGSAGTGTAIPGSDVDYLVIINGGPGAAVLADEFHASRGIIVNKIHVPISELKKLADELLYTLKAVIDGKFPKNGDVSCEIMSSRVGVTLKGKVGLVEADIIPAIKLVGGDFLTLNSDGETQYSPSVSVRRAVEQCNDDHKGMRALVRVLKLMYFLRIPDGGKRVPSSILLGLVHGTLDSISKSEWESTSFLDAVQRVVNFAKSSIFHASPFLRLPGDVSSMINMVGWTKAERILSLQEFLLSLNGDAKKMKEDISQCKTYFEKKFHE